MSKKFAVLALALVLFVVVLSSTNITVDANPETSTVYGVIRTDDRLYAYSFDGADIALLGFGQVQYTMYESFVTGAYLPGIEANFGTGLIIGWQDDSDPAYDMVRIFNTNGSSAGTLSVPANTQGADAFMDVDGKLVARLNFGETSSFWKWNTDLYTPPTEITFTPEVIDVRQIAYSNNHWLVGSGPNGRIVLSDGPTVLFSQPSNDNFHSSMGIVGEDYAFGEVDGSLFRIDFSGNPSFQWVATQNNIQEIAGNDYIVTQTYGASGTGLVTYDSLGQVVHTSVSLSSLHQLGAADEFIIVVESGIAKVLSATTHQVLDVFNELPVMGVSMTEPTAPVVYTTFMPMMMSAN